MKTLIFLSSILLSSVIFSCSKNQQDTLTNDSVPLILSQSWVNFLADYDTVTVAILSGNGGYKIQANTDTVFQAADPLKKFTVTLTEDIVKVAIDRNRIYLKRTCPKDTAFMGSFTVIDSKKQSARLDVQSSDWLGSF